jgi:hypothetical protein
MKSEPTSVDSVIVHRATASLEASAKDDMNAEDQDINKLLEEKDETAE